MFILTTEDAEDADNKEIFKYERNCSIVTPDLFRHPDGDTLDPGTSPG